MPPTFPPGFRWGAAAAAYQIEGATTADGRGESVWDVFDHRPGAVWQGHRGTTACDHYHRMPEDVALWRRGLGLQAYRFSVAWPRILPEGIGPVNAAGLDFYDRLVDQLLGHGIEPWLTLFHWDMPMALYRKGGWLNRESVEWFAEYTGVVVDRLSDRVRHWMTHNEFQCYLNLGLETGMQAPGDKLSRREVLLATHHAMLSHGRSVQVIRARARQPVQVGVALLGGSRVPASRSPADIEAARAATFAIDNLWSTAWIHDGILLGRLNPDGLARFGADAPVAHPGDLELMHQPLDFIGLNIYFAGRVRARAEGGWEDVPFPPGFPQTLNDWPVTPEAMEWTCRFQHERYGLPIAITENGLALPDWVATDGGVHDPQRIDFAAAYLRSLAQAGAAGVPLIAYFHWSVMDNFEWNQGYRYRFGLVHVDYATFERTIKDSGRWYAQVIASHGTSLG